MELCEVDINKSYFLDDDLNIWYDLEDFYEYHLEEYTGIKDGLETWQEELCEEHNIEELKGNEIIARVVEDLNKQIEYYKQIYLNIKNSVED